MTDKNSSTDEPSASDASGTFSIASSVVTSGFPIIENLSDTSYMLQSSNTLDAYQHNTQPNKTHLDQFNFADNNKLEEVRDDVKQRTQNHQSITDEMLLVENKSERVPNSVQESESQLSENNNASPGDNTSCLHANIAETNASSHSSSVHSVEDSQAKKKRNKAVKKSTKLDAKSKLEKSRQSARECRARKKLRYQYLEDLVCNREKAVVKLRDELSVFCKFSGQIDAGSISASDRQMLIEQTKENSQTS